MKTVLDGLLLTILVFTVVVIGVGIIFNSIVSPPKMPENVVQTEYTNYTYVLYDGMPCLVYDNMKRYGMTCDWSKWEGYVEDGELVLP